MNQIFSVVESAIDLLVLGRMIKEKKNTGHRFRKLATISNKGFENFSRK